MSEFSFPDTFTFFRNVDEVAVGGLCLLGFVRSFISRVVEDGEYRASDSISSSVLFVLREALENSEKQTILFKDCEEKNTCDPEVVRKKIDHKKFSCCVLRKKTDNGGDDDCANRVRQFLSLNIDLGMLYKKIGEYGLAHSRFDTLIGFLGRNDLLVTSPRMEYILLSQQASCYLHLAEYAYLSGYQEDSQVFAIQARRHYMCAFGLCRYWKSCEIATVFNIAMTYLFTEEYGTSLTFLMCGTLDCLRLTEEASDEEQEDNEHQESFRRLLSIGLLNMIVPLLFLRQEVSDSFIIWILSVLDSGHGRWGHVLLRSLEVVVEWSVWLRNRKRNRLGPGNRLENIVGRIEKVRGEREVKYNCFRGGRALKYLIRDLEKDEREGRGIEDVPLI